INTASTPPVLTNTDSSTIAGVVSNGISVFTFDQITIGAGVTVKGVRNAGSRPLALLSHGGFLNSGTIDLSGTNASNAALPALRLDIGINGAPSGSTAGNGGNAGPGGGGGGGGGAGVGGAGNGGLGFVNGQNGSSVNGSGG